MPTSETNAPDSRLLPVLREGICVVQMILFKELRALLTTKKPGHDSREVAMLAAAITNELFGAINEEPAFLEFRNNNRAEIEQRLLGLAHDLPALAAPLTDTLRMQALCDHCEQKDSTRLLTQAAEIGLLIREREIPLPPAFMAMARQLGDTHGLITAPAESAPDSEQAPIH